MRTLILLIVCAFIVNKLSAQQNDLAFLDSGIVESKSIQLYSYKTLIVSLNSDYLEKRIPKESSSIITEWKYRLANYDLKNSSIFDDSEKATYRIAYKNKQVDIIAIYNNKGKILSTNETYRNIKLPFELMVKISKRYPDYAFVKNTYQTTYNSKTGINKQLYQVLIGNGNQKKTLKFDKTFKVI